ncbi:response regulator transcription factor [Paraclostridium bifermentans]|uniref:response regulator transcription factor n=1 Tax=Paraclostridium bifermentans TaxID=1490 RepID=UPI00359C97E2
MDKKIEILIVEDDNDINKLLSDMVDISGYNSKSAYSGTEALIYLKENEFDMILLDLMIPGINGEELLEKIRQNYSMPIIVISAKDDKNTKIDMLKSGADDFISKPFDIDETIARIASNLRRYKLSSKQVSEKILIVNEIKINKDTRDVFINDNSINLTSREFSLLELFVTNPKKVFTKSNLFESVWKEEYMGDDNTISVHISNLRNKISKYANSDYIKTVWGIGYKLFD